MLTKIKRMSERQTGWRLYDKAAGTRAACPFGVAAVTRPAEPGPQGRVGGGREVGAEAAVQGGQVPVPPRASAGADSGRGQDS